MNARLPIEVDCVTVKSLFDSGADFLLLDCRETDEHGVARIAGARLLPMTELQARLNELDGDRTRRVVVHCHHGGRSLRVAAFLRQQGFTHAQSMAGGIDEWSQTIDPSVPRY